MMKGVSTTLPHLQFRLLQANRNTPALQELIILARNLTSQTAKAKTAKLMLHLIDFIPSSNSSVLEDSISWARSTNRLFLAQSLSLRLASLHLQTRHHKAALNILNTLLPELKRLDDKLLLAEVHLLESRVYHAINNVAKAKAALTSARTAANAIYCPPALQARLDVQSGILHAEDNDWKTAYSYFFEAFEGLGSASEVGEAEIVGALKYMLLCKVMMNQVRRSLHSYLGN